MQTLKKIILIHLFLLLVNEKILAQEINFFGAIQAGQTTITQSGLDYDFIQNSATITPLSNLGFKLSQSFDDKYQGLVQFVQTKSSDGLQMDLLQVSTMIDGGVRLRVGKQRLPNWLVSEHIQVSALLPWMTAPKELYDRMPVASFTGLSLEKNWGNFYAILFSGDTKEIFDNTTNYYDVVASNVIGVRLSLASSNGEFYVSHLEANPKLTIEKDVELTGAPGVFGKIVKQFRIQDYRLSNTGFRINSNKNLVMSEYSITSSDASLLEKFESAYFSLGRYATDDLLFLATYSTDIDVKSNLAPSETTSYILDVNYKLNLSNVLKFSYRHVNFREKNVASALSSSTNVNGTLTMASSPKENFDVYMAEWSFVF
jgi:hypothetical protein